MFRAAKGKTTKEKAMLDFGTHRNSDRQRGGIAADKGEAFTMFNDPGHAWLAVRKDELEDMGIMDKISPYSYQKGATVYLEEDCDFSVFVSARIARNKPFHVIEEYTDGFSPIRNFQSFNPAQSA
jgi:hypothetical protein